MSEPWVCPWDICNDGIAQICWATKTAKGCGGRFSEGTTLEQAKEMISTNQDHVVVVPLLDELRLEAALVPNRRGRLYALAADEIERLRAPTQSAEPSTDERVDLYCELLYAVGNKYPGETRHQTALRYIQQAETTTGAALASEEPK